MSRLADVYEGGSRWRSVARAGILLAGSLVATVGFVAATASLVAGFGLRTAGALRVAATLGGALLLAGFTAAFARRTAGGRSLTLGAAGLAVALAGLAVFWTTLPEGWAGRLDRLPLLGVGAYGAGLLAVFAAWLLAGPPADEKGRAGRTGASGLTEASGLTRNGTRTGEPDAERLGSVESVLTASEDDQHESVASAVADGSPSGSALRNESTPASAVDEHSSASATGDERPSASAVGDGGEAEDDLRFFDRDEGS